MIHIGTLLQEVAFSRPWTAIFFSCSPNKLIVACSDDIFVVDVSTQSTQPFGGTPHDAYYCPHALALSKDDAVLVAGNYFRPYVVCGYDTASLARLWTYNTVSHVGAVCMLGAHVLVTVAYNPTLVLDLKSGTCMGALQKASGWIFGLGVIEGLCFISFQPLIASDLHTSVYLAMMQHLLSKQVNPLSLPLEMWDWIAKYRV